MRGEVLDGVERRRRWSDEEKLRILMEVGLRGATLTDVARRHSVSRSQLYTWRRELKRHGAMRPPGVEESRPVFVPVAPPLLPAPAVEPAPPGDVASAASAAAGCEAPEAPADPEGDPADAPFYYANPLQLYRADADRPILVVSYYLTAGQDDFLDMDVSPDSLTFDLVEVVANADAPS
jgi:transposase